MCSGQDTAEDRTIQVFIFIIMHTNERNPKPLSLLKATNWESNSFALVHSKPSLKEELATSFHNRKFACDYNYSVTPYDLDHREFMRWLFIENKEHGGIFSPPLPECRLTQYLPLDPPCEESGRSIKVLQFPAKTLSRLFTYCSSAQTHWPCVSHNALSPVFWYRGSLI